MQLEVSGVETRAACGLLAAAVFLMGCAEPSEPQAGSERPHVSFDLGDATVWRDSTDVSYRTLTTRPLRARGADSLRPYLVAVEVGPSVSLEAGEAPERTMTLRLVDEGQGRAVDYTSAGRCGPYANDDCFDSYFEPEHTFEIKGVQKLHPLPDSLGAFRHVVSDSLTVRMSGPRTERTRGDGVARYTVRRIVTLEGPAADRRHLLALRKHDSVPTYFPDETTWPETAFAWVHGSRDTVEVVYQRLPCDEYPGELAEMVDCSDEPMEPHLELRPVGIRGVQPVVDGRRVDDPAADSLIEQHRAVRDVGGETLWEIKTVAVYRLMGADSTALVMGTARARARRSLHAGERPFAGVARGWGRGDSLTFTTTQTALRCDEYMQRDCLNEFVDPRVQFTPNGLLSFFPPADSGGR